MDASSVRKALPVPANPARGNLGALLGFGLFLLGAIWLYDAYDGAGRQGPWPVSTLFPW